MWPRPGQQSSRTAAPLCAAARQGRASAREAHAACQRPQKVQHRPALPCPGLPLSALSVTPILAQCLPWLLPFAHLPAACRARFGWAVRWPPPPARAPAAPTASRCAAAAAARPPRRQQLQREMAGRVQRWAQGRAGAAARAEGISTSQAGGLSRGRACMHAGGQTPERGTPERTQQHDPVAHGVRHRGRAALPILAQRRRVGALRRLHGRGRRPEVKPTAGTRRAALGRRTTEPCPFGQLQFNLSDCPACGPLACSAAS